MTALGFQGKVLLGIHRLRGEIVLPASNCLIVSRAQFLSLSSLLPRAEKGVRKREKIKKKERNRVRKEG